MIATALFACAVAAGRAGAQTGSGTGSVTVKAGLNVERAEDGLAGESAGLGLAVDYRFASRWEIEVELWVPRYMTVGPRHEHRDVQINVAATRAWRSAGLRPFLAFGAGFGFIDDRQSATASFGPDSTAYLHVGGGVEVPVHARVALVPEVRLNVGPAVAIVRPALGVRIAFQAR